MYLQILPRLTYVHRYIFTGIGKDDKYELVDRIINLLFLYEIWYCKTHRKIPSFTTIEFNMYNNFDTLVDSNKKFKYKVLNNINYWCRSWRQQRGHAEPDGRG